MLKSICIALLPLKYKKQAPVLQQDLFKITIIFRRIYGIMSSSFDTHSFWEKEELKSYTIILIGYVSSK